MKKFRIPLIKSTFYKEKETKTKLIRFIKSAKKLSMGKYVFEFEKKFAKWHGRKYGVMVNSGSSANLVLLQTLKNLGILKEGDKIAFSSITWSTNVMPIIQLGFVPVPVDVEIKTINVSPETLKKVYKKNRFHALFLTNLLGFCDDILEIKNFCEKNNIIFFEDNCESLGSEYKNIKLGNFSIASTTSFFVGHHLSTIEGGMILTDNLEIYETAKIVRTHGWSRDISSDTKNKLMKKFKIDKFYNLYSFYDLGYNLRPTEIQGFLGLIQLKYLDEIIRKREKNFLSLSIIYDDESIFSISTKGLTKISNFAFPIILKSQNKCKKLVKHLVKSGIETRPIVGGNMTLQPFWKKYVKRKYNLPNSSYLHNNGFYFGNNPELTKSDINYIIRVFDTFKK